MRLNSQNPGQLRLMFECGVGSLKLCQLSAAEILAPLVTTGANHGAKISFCKFCLGQPRVSEPGSAQIGAGEVCVSKVCIIKA